MQHLEHILECIHDKHIFIQTHNFPDPDAIASAYGLKVLLEKKGIGATICYKGRIDDTITAKMAQLLAIDIVEQEEITDMSAESEIILVDSQKGNANVIDMQGNEVLCIDHHPTYENQDYRYSDIRVEVGECASIIAGYFMESGIPVDKRTATALLYGIKVDTANMTRGVSPLDLEMFYRLFPLAEHALLQKLDTSVLHMKDLRAYANAIDTIENVNRVCFANTGVDCHEALTASISDFILALDEVDVVIVSSYREDGIKLSVRSSSPWCNAGKLTNEALKGIGNGGGHEHMAGGFIPFGNIPQNSDANSSSTDINHAVSVENQPVEQRAEGFLKEMKKRFLQKIENG